MSGKRMCGAAVAVVVGGLMTGAGNARAGTYLVHTCNTPDNQRSLGPTLDDPLGASGWIADGPAVLIQDQCPAGGPFTFRNTSAYAMQAGESIGARWTAAPRTRLVGVLIRWIGEALNDPQRGQGTTTVTVATDRQVLLTATGPWATEPNDGGAQKLSSTLLDASWFEIRLRCLDACPSPSGSTLRGWVNYASFLVRDDEPPAGGLVGPAVDAMNWSGVTRLRMTAADAGSGLRRAIVEVDGSPALAIPLSSSNHCDDVGPDPAVAEFDRPQPCPLRISDGALDVDSAKLPQGRHSVRVLLEDAAGNRTAIFGPVVRNIAANGAIGPGSDPALRGAANGDGATDQARLTAHWGVRGSRTRLVSGYGHRHVVRGRLRGQDGAPIANAVIDLVSKTTAVNARALVKRAGPRTASDGSWRLALPRNVSSRDLTFRYRSHVNDTIPTATAAVHLRVRAGLRLAIRPRVARRGQAIRFAGRLLGGPLPRGGKQIVLMARASRGGWVRFNVIRTERDGRFHTTYRFQQSGGATYRFRALSLAEAAYPYAAGGSNVVRVRKR
jgi:hypothetical protein